MCANLVDASLDVLLVTGSIYDSSVVLINDDGLAPSPAFAAAMRRQQHLRRSSADQSGEDQNEAPSSSPGFGAALSKS